MHRSDFSDLNTFLVISDHLSFRAAAAQLGVTSSAVSHSIRQLEERLGVRLLHRTTRSVSLIDSGIRLLERLRPGREQISSALEELKEKQHRLLGPFTHLHPYGLGRAHGLIAGMGTFLGQLPRSTTRALC
jgi:DNA-binding transcriptional LysR family regulator